jgi:hypothetical protein
MHFGVYFPEAGLYASDLAYENGYNIDFALSVV